MVQKTASGAIMFDADILKKITDAAFSAATWLSAEVVTGTFKSAGRGNTLIVSDGSNEFVLRHYLRGGAIGHLVRDNYFWSNEDSNRAFREWRLLAKLVELGLPVPTPAAARYYRFGILYKADLMTVRLPLGILTRDRLAHRVQHLAPARRAFAVLPCRPYSPVRAFRDSSRRLRRSAALGSRSIPSALRFKRMFCVSWWTSPK